MKNQFATDSMVFLTASTAYKYQNRRPGDTGRVMDVFVSPTSGYTFYEVEFTDSIQLVQEHDLQQVAEVVLVTT